MAKKKKRIKKTLLIENCCLYCKFKWKIKADLKRIQCPNCKKIIEQYDCKKKEAAYPIPEEKYEIFRDRLVELSGEKEKERNLVLFQLGIATGYRLGDIVNLTIGNILDALEEGEFCIQENKKYKLWLYREKEKNKKRLEGKRVTSEAQPEPRVIEIENNLHDILINYCEGKRRSEYAFISSTNPPEHIQASSFSKVIKKVSEDKQLKLKNISGHSLRKTYATRLYIDYGDIEFVRQMLGHESVTTTQRYLRLDKIMRKKAAVSTQRKL